MSTAAEEWLKRIFSCLLLEFHTRTGSAVTTGDDGSAIEMAMSRALFNAGFLFLVTVSGVRNQAQN
jgi:hypothetical protein